MIIPFSKLTAAFLHAGKETIPEMWALNGQKDQITYKMMREWDSQGFDAIISCPFPMPAISPDFCSKIISGIARQDKNRHLTNILYLFNFFTSCELHGCLQPDGVPCRDPPGDCGDCPGPGGSGELSDLRHPARDCQEGLLWS